MARVRALGERARQQGELRPATALFALDGATLLPPILVPSKIIAVGLNYRDHAEEQNKPLPEVPLLFSKASTCLQGADGPIELAGGARPGGRRRRSWRWSSGAAAAPSRGSVPASTSPATCASTTSPTARRRNPTSQWFRGKSLDTGGPCGPWLVTPDELPDLAAGPRHRRALERASSCRTATPSQLIFPVDVLIAYASRHMTLLPGDIISTGTPGGRGRVPRAAGLPEAGRHGRRDDRGDRPAAQPGRRPLSTRRNLHRAPAPLRAIAVGAPARRRFCRAGRNVHAA